MIEGSPCPSSAYDEAKAAYLSAGLPWEARHLCRSTPPEHNSAIELKALSYPPSPAKQSLDRSNPSKKSIEARSELLDRAAEALKLPEFNWQSDWSRGPYAAGESAALLRTL